MATRSLRRYKLNVSDHKKERVLDGQDLLAQVHILLRRLLDGEEILSFSVEAVEERAAHGDVTHHQLVRGGMDRWRSPCVRIS